MTLYRYGTGRIPICMVARRQQANMGSEGIEEVANPRAATAEDAGDSSRKQEAPTLRRSRRESAVKAEVVKAPEPPPQRRSQRAVKPTEAAKDAAKPKEPVNTKKPTKPIAETTIVESTPTKSRARGENVALTVDTGTPLVNTEDGSSVVRSRRPSRRQAETESVTVTPGGSRSTTHLLLGRFSPKEATILCEVIWQHLKENAHKPDVLLQDVSPARIDWPKVSEKLARTHRILLSAALCQRLWKFLAYGEGDGDAVAEEDKESDAEVVDDSEPEDYDLSVDEINRRVLARREQSESENADTRGSALAPTDATDDTINEVPTAHSPTPEQEAAVSQASEPIVATNQPAAAISSDTTDPAAVKTANDKPTPTPTNVSTTTSTQQQSVVDTRRTAGVQLYPEYDQPVGIPDGWERPFSLKQMLPLVFVAEKFLKRKALTTDADPTDSSKPTATTLAPSILAAAAQSVILSGEILPMKGKRKRKSDAADGDATDKPKKPRKKKDSNAVPPTGTTPTSAKPTPPMRQVFTLSTTPPPMPTPARTTLSFFQQKCKADASLLAGVAPESALIDYTALFAQAPEEIRLACEQLATEDLRRFEREQLRRRLWEKTTGSRTNSPAPSPGPAASMSGTTSQISAVPSAT